MGTSRKAAGKSKPYRVGRSATGLGLFATVEIAKGAFIIEYMGRRISTAQAARLEARGARYLYEIDGRWRWTARAAATSPATPIIPAAPTPNPTWSGAR